MLYIAHIFSGVAMALKVIDFKYRNSPPDDIDKFTHRLKRAIFGYLLHDYNKFDNYEENKNMDKMEILGHLAYSFEDIMKDLNLQLDDIYFIAFSTEKGTQFHANSNTVTLNSNLSFESSFSRLADQLSSIYLYEGPEIKDIVFNNEPLIPAKHIQRIKIGSTPYILFSSIVRNVLTMYIEKYGYYLWSSINTIYYISENELIPEISELMKLVENEISKRAHMENGISLTDRRIDISSNKLGRITKDSITNFIADNDKFKQVLHLEDITFNSTSKGNAEEFSNLFLNSVNSYSINFHLDLETKKGKEHSIREYLRLNDFDKDIDSHVQERLHSFMVRYVQLQRGLKSIEAEKVRKRLNAALKEYSSLIGDLLPKSNKEKSALFIPLVISDESIIWEDLMNDILKDMNSGFDEDTNHKIISAMLDIVLDREALEIPEVPEKKNMSMINGYPAQEKGIKENLFGIGTNTFNNRLPTSAIGNGKIDSYSIYEFSLRKNLAPRAYGKYSSAILFMSFPGAIPFMNMEKFLSLASGKDDQLRVGNIRLTIEDNESKLSNFKLDSTYFIYLPDPVKDSDMIKNLSMCLDIAMKSKLHLLLSFSNNLFYETWNETINIELENSILNGMAWNKVRCNKLAYFKKELSFFLTASRKNGKIDYDEAANILRTFIADRMSLNFYVHKQIFDRNNFMLNTKEKWQLYHDLVYEKKGELMKEIVDLGKAAAELYRLKSSSSGSDRGWMVRESIELLEKMKSETNSRSLYDLSEFVSGHLYKGLERMTKRDNPNSSYKPNIEKVNEFTGLLLDILMKEFKGKIPSGVTRSYLIDGFEIEYKLASESIWNQSKKESE